MARLRDRAWRAGVYGPQLSPEWGGLGLDWRTCALVFEEAGYSLLGPYALNCAAPDEGNMHLLEVVANHEQKERFLAPLARGEARSCFAMTEPAPGAGSDPAMLRTRARQEDRRPALINLLGQVGYDATPQQIHDYLMDEGWQRANQERLAWVACNIPRVIAALAMRLFYDGFPLSIANRLRYEQHDFDAAAHLQDDFVEALNDVIEKILAVERFNVIPDEVPDEEAYKQVGGDRFSVDRRYVWAPDLQDN